MSVFSASLRRVAMTLIVGVAIAAPISANASILNGLSVRLGGLLPQKSVTRDVTGTVAWGGGIDYKLPWFPKLMNGEYWSTSVSADILYSGRNSGVTRYIPVAINQVYHFEEANGHTPYAGFSFLAATYGANRTQPMVTRFGAGLILGLELDSKWYVEGRYDFIDGHGTTGTPEGFRANLGYRF